MSCAKDLSAGAKSGKTYGKMSNTVAKGAEETKKEPMKAANLVFPHQLFQKSPLLDNELPIYIVEEFLFFNQYRFHKQKLVFHRASMKAYEKQLLASGKEVTYIDSTSKLNDIRELIGSLSKEGINTLHYIDPTDDWLNERIRKQGQKEEIALETYESPLFLNTKADLSDFFKPSKKKFFQTTFYIEQRKKWKMLIDEEEKPNGGKWSFDDENRKKYPKEKTPPTIQYPDNRPEYDEAITYIGEHFTNNPGEINKQQLYPIDSTQSKDWLKDFLENRFHEFGAYEDAIVDQAAILNHSLLSPLMNVGLLSPDLIIDEALKTSRALNTPINSVEGFVRQITGWREFIRGIYECKGREQRTTNYWKFKNKIPDSFYDGTTGIKPFDDAIKKVLQTGYCHHIERLMILGNFMMLCEIDPDDVYQWFMELFIDAYDWVMVPNVYGMSQFSDGGLMATKPYISGSNYLMKMSNYKKGDWQPIWDGLFWRFMDTHRDFFLSNPRIGMLVKTFDKMDEAKKEAHLKTAEDFLTKIR